MKRRDFEVIFLDKSNKPVRFATITENSKNKAIAVGRNMAHVMGGRFHEVRPVKK